MGEIIMSRRPRGFTIVELLIVIIVIAILAAIVMVTYNGVQERARMANAVSFEQSFRNKYIPYATGIWTFNECSGSSVKNTSDTNTTDAISGTVSWITSGTPTGQGCALHFDGTTHIETTTPLGASWYAKGAWVRISAASCGSYNIISQAATNGATAALFAPNCHPAAGHNGSWYSDYSPTTINDNKWHYIALTWENGTLTLYVDGQVVSTAAGIPTPTNATGYVAIGSNGGGSFMVGDIAHPFVAAQ